jgi:hypothetical protein
LSFTIKLFKTGMKIYKSLIMKKIILLTIMTCFLSYGFAQKGNVWTVSPLGDVSGQIIEKANNPTSAVIFHLNFNQLQTVLETAPQRGMLQKKQDLILQFPNAEGELERFTVREASTLHPELSARYGGIKSYAGQGIDDPTSKIRFSVSHIGFHGMIRSGERSTCFIDPLTTDNAFYIVYARKDISGITSGFNCYTPEGKVKPSKENGNEKATDDSKLRKYRLALSCTAEYGNIFDGTGTDAEKKANILAQMNVTMTRVNGVYEDDLAITMEIIPNNDEIIYFGATNSDPWNNEWNNTTQTTIDNIIGNANYDIGHNFNTTGGGNAGCIGCVCSTGSKGSAYTGRSNPTGDPFDIDYVAHEMGHQFGGYHTQSNSSCRSGSGQTEVEPGSASTIMGYAGICSANVQSNSDDYFNYVNIRDISANVQGGTSSGCAVEINLGNNAPTADAGSDYTIPKSTAFVLKGTGSDPDGDVSLTYTWEQNDPENPSSNSAPPPTRTQGPMFRSFKGTSSPDRYMPRIADVVAGNLTPTWEVVPSVSRNMEFALTVRDNTAGGGQTADDLMNVTVNASAGPFVVNSPNTNVTWNVGGAQTVTWDVANTSSAPVSCSNVNILLSTDGGYTYPITVAANTANDGSQVITVPNNLSTNCRIKVEAADNIFYDISNTNFTIEGTVVCNANVPTGLVASGVTSSSATLSWDAVPGATYDVIYRETGGSWTAVSGIAGTSTTLTGLTSLTSYEAQVRSVCSGGATSAYSSSVNFSTTEVQLNYCNSQGNNVSDEYIGRVQLSSIDNTSGALGYSDFTAIATDLTQSSTNTITVTCVWTGTVYNEAYSVWIDYNKDGDFGDAGEQVWTQGNTQTSPVSGNFTVPASAALGNTRMRVSMKYNGLPTACETFTYGEVEDYTVNIVSAGCPAQGTACNDNDPSTFNDVEDGNCNCAGTACPTAETSCDDGDASTFNDVTDGSCGCAGTPCPDAGTSCDDNDASTFNDLEDGNCNCIGTPCPTAGTSCDDGNPTTENDVEDGNCGCAGTPCPTANTTCDDGDPTTENDVEDGFCGCAGTPCPTAGTSCDDGDPNTSNDVEDGNCNCAGVSACTTTEADNNDFEAGWGIWNDGGSDCRRSNKDKNYALGDYCVRLRDNTSTSVMTTDDINLSSFENLTVDFSYYARSMENGEDFWLQISTDGGASYITVGDWDANDEFVNNTRYYEQVAIAGPFTSNTRLRFRCDASGNSDYVYIDEVVITGCSTGSFTNNTNNLSVTNTGTETIVSDPVTDSVNKTTVFPQGISDLKLSPNPTDGQLNVSFTLNESSNVQMVITSLTGQVVMLQDVQVENGAFKLEVDTTPFGKGVYFLSVITKDDRVARKFVVVD